jgi:hypothetical protein
MNTSPTLRSGNTTVVWEGPRRLVWRRASATRWVPTGLWPDAEQAAELAEDLGNGGRLLVVLSPSPTTVQLLAEELADAPPAVQRLAGDHSPASRPGHANDPLDLEIPLLDWLPEPVRQRGIRFQAECAALLAEYPPALLPRLLVERPRDPASPIRFVHPVPASSLSGRHLWGMTPHLFAPRVFGPATPHIQVQHAPGHARSTHPHRVAEGALTA